MSARLREGQAVRGIGRFAGGIAHDLNNLLAIVIGNLDELCEGPLHNSCVADLVSDALEAALRGAELSRSLLALGRGPPRHPQRIDVNDVISGTARLFAHVLRDDITLELSLMPGLWPVLVDRASLEAAIINLAINARDAMPNGGGLTIASRNDLSDAPLSASSPRPTFGDYVVIETSDSGHGMPPEVLSRVFEPFFTTKEAHRGTGLGLFMVSQFATLAGGFVTAHSEPGRGSTVRLCLPRAQPQATS
jgi:signal transduction histidine kinase